MGYCGDRASQLLTAGGIVSGTSAEAADARTIRRLVSMLSFVDLEGRVPVDHRASRRRTSAAWLRRRLAITSVVDGFATPVMGPALDDMCPCLLDTLT
jgi:hypothetical protein